MTANVQLELFGSVSPQVVEMMEKFPSAVADIDCSNLPVLFFKVTVFEALELPRVMEPKVRLDGETD